MIKYILGGDEVYKTKEYLIQTIKFGKLLFPSFNFKPQFDHQNAESNTLLSKASAFFFLPLPKKVRDQIKTSISLWPLRS